MSPQSIKSSGVTDMEILIFVACIAAGWYAAKPVIALYRIFS